VSRGRSNACNPLAPRIDKNLGNPVVKRCRSIRLWIVGGYVFYPSTTSSFYRPRGGGLQSCHTALSDTYGGMAHNVVELTVVLTNLASGGRRGESCDRPGVASRVVARQLLVCSPSIRRFEGWADEKPEVAQWLAWRPGFPQHWG
jgi:hypothetical protein